MEVQDEDSRLWNPARVGGGDGSIQGFEGGKEVLRLSYPEVMGEFVRSVTRICTSEASSGPNNAEEKTGVVNLTRGG